MPITVRLVTSRRDSDVTAQVQDLTTRSVVPGGFASATFSLNRPLNITPDDIEYFASVIVHDARHGGVLWEGRLEDPGRSADSAGTAWRITAVGPSAHTRDANTPLVYVDTSVERWVRSNASTGDAVTQVSEAGDPLDPSPSLQVRANEGTTVTTLWQGDFIYRHIFNAGQILSRVRGTYIAEGASSNYQVGFFLRQGYSGSTGNTQSNWVTTAAVLVFAIGGAGWDNLADVVSFRATRNVSTTTANTTAGAQIYDITVRSLLKAADGTDITTPSVYAGDNFVSTVEVVKDLLGRRLTKYDGANATVLGSGVDIKQLCYPDGITADELLSDLAVFDPAYYWAAWESNPANGKYRFEYIPWPTTVRYDADIFDGFDSPGSANDLYNAVTVRYVGPAGAIKNVVRTQTVQVLTDAGLTRQAFIDISDEIGSAANAQVVGDNFLLEHQTPPNAGTLTVSRPIIDLVENRMVQPWEIRPGGLIRVRGVLPRIDSLNPTDRDGVTVFRVVSVEFTASTGSAVLELDSYSRTVAQALKDAKNRRIRKR
jgi:hypothetical protein